MHKIYPLDANLLQDSQHNMIAVASVAPTRDQRPPASYRDWRIALTSTHAMGQLITIFFAHHLGDVYYVSSDRVLIMTRADLLTPAPVGAVCTILDGFQEWARARLITVTGDSPATTADDGNHFAIAQQIAVQLATQHGITTMDAATIDTNYIAWTRKCARASSYRITGGTANGPLLTVTMPARNQLFPSPIEAISSSPPPNIRFAQSIQRGKLIILRSGKVVFIPNDAYNNRIQPGDTLTYSDADSRNIGTCRIITN